MNELVYVAPHLALICGVVLIGNALRLSQERVVRNARRRWFALILLGAAVPSLSQAQVTLKTAVESGNAIVMYLCGVFAAIGIVTAGPAVPIQFSSAPASPAGSSM